MQALPALISASRESNALVREMALDAIAGIGSHVGEEVTPFLVAALEDESVEVCAAAAKALARVSVDDKCSVDALVRLLEASREHGPQAVAMRYVAADALRTLGPRAREAIPALIGALGDSDMRVRGMAKEALAAIGTEAVSELIAAQLDAIGQHHREAIEVIGLVGPEADQALPQLIDALASDTRSVRLASVSALTSIGRPAVPALVAGLESDHQLIRSQILVALAKMEPCFLQEIRLNGTQVGTELVQMLNAADPHSCTAATVLLATVGEDALPILLQAWEQAESDTARYRQLPAFGTLGADAKAAVPLLIETLANATLRDRAVAALGKIGADAVPALIECLNDERTRVRRAAIKALGFAGPEAKEAVPVLVERLRKRGKQWFSEGELVALSKIGQPAVVALIELLSHENKNAREAAVWALGEVGAAAEDAVPALISVLEKPSWQDTNAMALTMRKIGPLAATAMLDSFNQNDKNARVNPFSS